MTSIKNYNPGSPIDAPIVAKRGDTFNPKPIVGYKFDGTPYDFTGHTFRLTVRKGEDGELLLTVPNDSFTITQNADGVSAGVFNVVEIEHTEADMLFTSGKWVYDIEMTDASGKVDTIYQSSFTLTKDVST